MNSFKLDKYTRIFLKVNCLQRERKKCIKTNFYFFREIDFDYTRRSLAGKEVTARRLFFILFQQKEKGRPHFITLKTHQSISLD